MKQQLDNAIQWIKDCKILGKPIQGCISGSSLLDTFWEGMDIDVFVYSPEEFINIIWRLYYDPMFTITDEREIWKLNRYVKENSWSKKDKLGIKPLKFMYNTCIPVNIIYKSSTKDIFSVLSSFDMDLVSIGYNLPNGKYLDLGDKFKRDNKIASWNKWNTQFDDPTIWSASKMLRQVTRIVKYHQRGYNTDNVANKYIEVINIILKEHDIWDSAKYDDLLKTAQTHFKIIKQILLSWLDSHEMSEETIEKLNKKIKEL